MTTFFTIYLLLGVLACSVIAPYLSFFESSLRPRREVVIFATVVLTFIMGPDARWGMGDRLAEKPVFHHEKTLCDMEDEAYDKSPFEKEGDKRQGLKLRMICP